MKFRSLNANPSPVSPDVATSSTTCSMICVHQSKEEKVDFSDRSGLKCALAFLCLSRNDQLSAVDLEILAQEYNVFFGKWLIFSSPASVDMEWVKVAEGVVADVLGPVAKFLPKKSGEKTHVICVYTENYLDMEDVKKVREGLRELGFTRELQCRTDAFTYCGSMLRTSGISTNTILSVETTK